MNRELDPALTNHKDLCPALLARMRSGAERLVKLCAGVRLGELVVIIADRERAPIGEALRLAAQSAGARALTLIPPIRKIDNEEPVEAVAVALRRADIAFLPVTLALAHTRAVREAIASGTRVLSMTAFTPRMMEEGGLFTDFEARRPLCERLATLLTNASGLRVTNPAGTDLSFSIERRNGNSHCCLLREAGFTAVPNIEANISPVEGSAAGRLVVDGSIPYYGVGVIEEPVTFEVEAGFVYQISGGEQAGFLASLLAAQNDRYVYNIAQFAFGLNPDCKDFTGEMLNDEGINGTIHIGIGTSASLGGETQAKTHFDAIVRAPSVWLDGKPIMVDGELRTGS